MYVNGAGFIAHGAAPGAAKELVAAEHMHGRAAVLRLDGAAQKLVKKQVFLLGQAILVLK